MLRKSVSKVVAMMCAAACVITAVPVMNVEASNYTAEELYNDTPSWEKTDFPLFTSEEYEDMKNKYNYTRNSRCQGDKFGKLLDNLKNITVSVENDRTGGINVRWFACQYSVAIERYDYATKQWELLGYKNDDETSAYKEYMTDMGAGDTQTPYYTFAPLSNVEKFNDCSIYEDDTVQLNKTYKYRITPFNVYSQSRAEAVALGKEAEYDKIVSEYEANGCKVVEENGYSVVFYPSHTTKKVKNTLEAPYMSVKETKYCNKCKIYEDAYNGIDTCTTHNKKYKHQITFDIEWQDVDGYEIYYSNYSDTGFKKWKTVKPKAISHSKTAYPARVSGQDRVVSTTFLLHTKLSNGKYFYKVRSYVIVNGKKVYSEFSPVTSTYDYIVHDSLEIKEANVGEEVALIQSSEEYNKLNRLMNEHGYLWKKYLTGSVSKNSFIKKDLAIDDCKMYSSYKYGIYKKTVKTLNIKNVQATTRDIKNAIQSKHPKMLNIGYISANITYKKSKKAYEITVMYNGT